MLALFGVVCVTFPGLEEVESHWWGKGQDWIVLYPAKRVFRGFTLEAKCTVIEGDMMWFLAGTEKVLLPKIDPPACGCLAFLWLGTMPERPAVPSDTLPTSWLRPEIPALNLRLNFPLQPTPKHVLPTLSPNSKIKVLGDTYNCSRNHTVCAKKRNYGHRRSLSLPTLT